MSAWGNNSSLLFDRVVKGRRSDPDTATLERDRSCEPVTSH
jgi:hypothetical protein